MRHTVRAGLLTALLVVLMLAALAVPAGAQYTPPPTTGVTPTSAAVKAVEFARTGSDSWALARVGFGALVLGVGLVVLVRRRRTEPGTA